ncbi:MAG: hypothetical protein E7634_08555 [Ruminococcaceae bacterium]|nr:hypothetical protein [Oscillospiraceae bacterium]
METISLKDKEILREIAYRKAELAVSQRNAEILSMWDALSKGIRRTPTVRLLYSNFRNEVIGSRLRCEGKDARALESSLLAPIVGRELFDDDTPVSPTLDVGLLTGAYPFSAHPKSTRAKGSNGYHIEPLTDDIEADIELFKGGSFYADPQKTAEYCAWVDEIIGDILPTRVTMGSLTGSITNPLVRMISMETYYLSMYDSPDALHEIMDTATTFFERYYDYLEQNGLLLPTNNFSPVAQESFAFTSELPSEGPITSTRQVWGFLESQETTAVSPETFGEFVFPYQDRLVKRYGLLSYGCCERVDDIWEDYLSKWTNLRKLSVSPFNDERRVGEYLRGTNVVYYSKPRAEYVTNRGPLDEDALRRYFKGVCESASGCLFEMAQREVGTIFGDFERGRRYVQIAKECIEEYWKP